MITNIIESDVMSMKSTGIVRKVDELGRVVLPVEFRRALDIEIKDEIEVRLDDDRLIIKKYEQTCLFCSCSVDLVTYMGKSVCVECIRKMNKT